jgi:hypothetical protein
MSVNVCPFVVLPDGTVLVGGQVSLCSLSKIAVGVLPHCTNAALHELLRREQFEVTFIV